MMATAADAMGDVATTTATILSVLFFRVTGINIDGLSESAWHLLSCGPESESQKIHWNH